MRFIGTWLILLSFHWNKCYFQAPFDPAVGAGPQVTNIYFYDISIPMGPSLHVCMMKLTSYADLL